MLFKIKSNPMPSFHCICRICCHVLLVVLWLLIGTRSRLLVVVLLSIADALCPSLCLFGTILVTLCLMVWDLWVSRAGPMLSCWHNLLFLFCLLRFFFSLHGLVVWGWGLWTDRVSSLCPCLTRRTPNNSNNNNNNKNVNKTINYKIVTREIKF